MMRSIVKRYGAVVADDSVDFDLHPGEVHALLGENGAGKTTLMNILFGMIAPDSGEILVEGNAVNFKSPRDALARKIGMVHQHFMLVPQFTIAENVVLGSKPPWDLRLRKSDIERDVRDVAHQYGIELEPSRTVGSLSIDAQQRVEILKLLYRGATTLVLDEPTAALGPTEIQLLFDALRELSHAGHSIVIITHKLSEVMSIADRVTVLRHGKVVMVGARGEFNEDDLARAMVGHSLNKVVAAPRNTDSEQTTLSVDDVVIIGDRDEVAVDHVGFGVRPGEILGIAGVEGNGQRELAQALGGLRRIASGVVQIDGVDVTNDDPRRLHRRGVSIITEDRLQWDLIPDLTITENLALEDVANGVYRRRGLLQRRPMRARAMQLLKEYGVEPLAPELPAGYLSGGNQQKVVLARELARHPRVLIVAQPTRGLDVAASEFVHGQLLQLRTDGCAILLFSLDLQELLALADRIVVLYRGRIAYADSVDTLSMERVARAMTGMKVSA